jgi:hypothetical protein
MITTLHIHQIETVPERRHYADWTGRPMLAMPTAEQRRAAVLKAKRWREENREKSREYQREWAKSHRKPFSSLTDHEKEEKKARTRTWRKMNPSKRKEYQARYRVENKEKIRDTQRKMRHGVSGEEYRAILEAQGGRCGCCGAVSSGTRRSWCVDHDHKTGVIRGVLCARCNYILGHLGDDESGLEQAYARFKKYLKDGTAVTAAVLRRKR